MIIQIRIESDSQLIAIEQEMTINLSSLERHELSFIDFEIDEMKKEIIKKLAEAAT